MKTVEEYFQSSIAQYQLLEQETSKLADELASLAPEEILARCIHIQEMQKQIAEDDHRLIELIKFVGPDVLDTPSIGEYQRALERAIKASDRVSARAHTQKSILSGELDKLKTGIKGLASYKSVPTQKAPAIQGKY
jgi:hypothetical protein